MGIRTEDDMQMYICCMLPRFWPLRWLWRWRMKVWCDLIREEHPSAHIIASSSWTSDFYDHMGIHNDGRSYAMIIRNDGSILWGSHDKFKEHRQQKDMVRVMQEEVEERVEEQRLLLETREAEAQLPQSPEPGGESPSFHAADRSTAK